MRPFIALACATLSLATTARADEPPPGSVAVQSVTLAGDGCPEGTAAVDVAPDARAFTVVMSRYVAEAFPGSAPAQARRSCQIDVTFAVVPGWTFTLASVDFRGYAALDAGARGQQVSSAAYPPRMALTRLAGLDLFGPHATDYQNHVEVPPQARITAPCVGATRRLLLRTSLGVTARFGARALMTVDSVDGVVEHRYAMAWQRCP